MYFNQGSPREEDVSEQECKGCQTVYKDLLLLLLLLLLV